MLDGPRPRTFVPQVSSTKSTMRGLRALAWLACLGACAAKPDAVNAKKTAREVAAEMIESKLATQTTRPVFEEGFAGPRRIGCVGFDDPLILLGGGAWNAWMI